MIIGEKACQGMKASLECHFNTPTQNPQADQEIQATNADLEDNKFSYGPNEREQVLKMPSSMEKLKQRSSPNPLTSQYASPILEVTCEGKLQMAKVRGKQESGQYNLLPHHIHQDLVFPTKKSKIYDVYTITFGLFLQSKKFLQNFSKQFRVLEYKYIGRLQKSINYIVHNIISKLSTIIAVIHNFYVLPYVIHGYTPISGAICHT